MEDSEGSDTDTESFDPATIDPAPCYMFRDIPSEEDRPDLIATTRANTAQNTIRQHIASLLACPESDLLAALEGEDEDEED